MKKNIITIGLLLIYSITFIFLFMRLRSLSGIVLEELGENNIYYILGFMFLAGISATLYQIMDSTSKSISSETEKEEGSLISEEETLVDDTAHSTTEANLDAIKLSLRTIIERQELSESERLEKAIWKICNYFEISQALLYIKGKEKGNFELRASFAFVTADNDSRTLLLGEGLTGQAVKDGKPYFIKDVPEGYMKVISGLGESLPKTLLIVPCKKDEEVISLFELSSLQDYTKNKFEEIVSICTYISTLITISTNENQSAFL